MGGDRKIHDRIQHIQNTVDNVAQELEIHLLAFTKHETEEITRHSELIESQQTNTKAIDHLVAQLQIQSEDMRKDRESTAAIIATWDNIISFAKGISWLRNSVLWVCASIVGIGGVVILGTKTGWW